MIFQQRPLDASSQPARDEMDMTRAWESNDYLDFMAAILLGVTLTALALSVI